MKKILFVWAALALLILLFSHPALTAAGCSLGLTLWYTAVLPSLLPFLIVSGLLIRTGLFRYLNRIYAPVLSRLFGISPDGCYAVIAGFLCGFPMGAKTTADLVREGCISPEEGTYLLGFCNNVSPAFFLNYICLLKLGYERPPWALTALFFAVPLAYGVLSRPFFHFRPVSDKQKHKPLCRIKIKTLDACLMDSFATVTRLGGYIVLFTILIQLLTLTGLPAFSQALSGAFLEVSSGVHALSALDGIPDRICTALCCSCAAFGGLCICAQTSSVLAGTPLRIRTWIAGRLVVTLLTFLLVLLLPSAAPALRGCW
ncbi:MAG: transporter [Eubacteriales bacterium]|nr:transporter [Eubacteriales bacterium]